MPDDLLSPDEINALLSGDGGDFGDIDELSTSDSEQLAKFADTFANAENSVINMLAGKNVTTNIGSYEVMSQSEFHNKFSEESFDNIYNRRWFYFAIVNNFNNLRQPRHPNLCQ